MSAGSQRVDVVGLGYCVHDTLAIVPRIPAFDDVLGTHVTDLVHDGGGQAGTALTTLARLGVSTGYVGVLGDDVDGRWLEELFEIEGVDVARLRRSEQAGTNICLLLVEESTGRRSILCHQRVALEDLELDEEDRAFIAACRVLHLDGQFMPAALQAARWARAAGAKICFDGNHPRAGLDQLLPLVDWLVVAESFPAAYTGHTEPRQAAESLLSLGADALVITQGERGCDVWTADGSFHSPGFAVDAVDTTGAGDAFHGGFIYGMLQEWELAEVARFANAVAALNCRVLGGRRGLPALEQVQELIGARP